MDQAAKPHDAGTANDVEAVLKRDDQWTPEAQVIVDRYRYYVDYGQHLDPTAWADRNKRET